MAITISGSGITSANIADGTIVNADVNDVAASKLTGALPAISGASLTNLPAGGKVLQVVYAQATGSTNISTTTVTDVPGMNVTLTPASTSSKVHLSFSAGIYGDPHLDGCCAFYFYRSIGGGAYTSVLWQTSTFDNYIRNESYHKFFNKSFIDSPATTSSITYKVVIAKYNSSNVIEICPYSQSRNFTAMEVET